MAVTDIGVVAFSGSDPATISLCMIVRDEATSLPRFLEAARGCFDELCVVDTGSTDDTVAILEAAGARVAHQVWQEDFAQARNASLELATGDWILILDPDELPSPELAPALREVTQIGEVGALFLAIRNLLDGDHYRDFTALRAFRRAPGVRFEHRIHEDAGRSVGEMLVQTGRVVATIEPVIVHEGYLRQHAAHKRTRDRRILKRAIAERPTDLYLRFKLLEQARFWDDRRLWTVAARSTIEALAYSPSMAQQLASAPWGGELLTLLAAGRSDEPAEQLALLESWGASLGSSPALTLRTAELMERVGRLDDARAAFRRCLQLRSDGSAQRTTTRPLLGLTRLAILGGELDRARSWCTQALAQAPHDAEALLAARALGIAC